jgi:hypothetical protein
MLTLTESSTVCAMARVRSLPPALATSALAVALAAAAACAHPGVGIVMDAGGNVFYTDLKQVWKIAPDGTKAIAVAGVHTHELCLDAEGRLYGEHLWYEGEATDRWGHRVWRLDPDGTLADVVSARQGFREDHGYSFVRDGAGNMYWADRPRARILRRTPDGAITTLAAADDLGETRWMTAGARAVKRVDPSGAVTVVARSAFPWSPTGGLVSPAGELWLLETSVMNAVRVRRIGKDGRETLY